MIGRILCFFGLHDWEVLSRPSRCEYYPFPIILNKTCKRCGKVVIPKHPHDNSEED